MFWLEMQAEWARSMLQLTEANIRSFTAAVETVVETVQPKPEPVSPVAVMFGSDNPFLTAYTNWFAPLSETMNGGRAAGHSRDLSGGLLSSHANPWVHPTMASLWANTPFSGLMSDQRVRNQAFGSNLLGSGVGGGGNLWNADAWLQPRNWAPWNAGMAAFPMFSGNSAFSCAPWASLWQIPAQIPNMGPWMAPFGHHAATAWLAPFQPRTAAVASPSAWTWPLNGSGWLH